MGIYNNIVLIYKLYVLFYLKRLCCKLMNKFVKENFSNKKIGFIGIGISHIGTMKFFKSLGFDVCAYDKSSEEKIGKKIIDDLKEDGIKINLGEDYYNFHDCDIIFRTPGMKFFDEELIKFRNNGRYVTSEMEMFFTLCPCKTIAVTGSDGKTTTSTIISEMLKKAGYTTHLGGNIGKALLPLINDININDVAVIELSSFQLISMTQSPDISVVTNLEQNHLDIHKDMNEYINSKKNIFLHQGPLSKTVLNFKNKIIKSFKDEVRGRLLWTNNINKENTGAYLGEDGYIYYKNFNETIKIFNKDKINLVGEHNVENYLCAITALFDMVSIDDMLYVAQNFNGVEHRMEFVKEVHGIKFFNDSIASSPTRTMAGLSCFNQKITLIAGGYDKKLDYMLLSTSILNKVKNLILMGDTADKIEIALKNNPLYKPNNINIVYSNNMSESVEIALSLCKSGDIIALSPASASFDKYKNFEARGRDFKDIVNKL